MQNGKHGADVIISSKLCSHIGNMGTCCSGGGADDVCSIHGASVDPRWYQDPSFVQELLGSLPGVDVNDPRIQSALQEVSGDTKEDAKDGKDASKGDGKDGGSGGSK